MAPSYFIATRSCVVPHVVDPQAVSSTNKALKIYIDDILYKDSAYDQGFDLPIGEFCAIPGVKTCLGFRNRPKVLVSKRGHYKLTKERYGALLGVLRPDYHADFESGKVFVEGRELVEPASVAGFVELLGTGDVLFGTEFVNGITDQGLMMRRKGNKLGVGKIFDCRCCGDLAEGYLEHLWRIKEMNALTYIAIHNYNTIEAMCKDIEAGELDPAKIVLEE